MKNLLLGVIILISTSFASPAKIWSSESEIIVTSTVTKLNKNIIKFVAKDGSETLFEIISIIYRNNINYAAYDLYKSKAIFYLNMAPNDHNIWFYQMGEYVFAYVKIQRHYIILLHKKK